MIITKLVNNLKCLTQYYHALVERVDRIEPTLGDYFQTETLVIAASEVEAPETHVIELPSNIQIIAILIVRVGEDGFDDVESFNVYEYSLVVNEGVTTLSITTVGVHSANDYEIRVIYRYL